MSNGKCVGECWKLNGESDVSIDSVDAVREGFLYLNAFSEYLLEMRGNVDGVEPDSDIL